MDELELRRVAQTIADRLRERYAARRVASEGIVDSVRSDAYGKVVAATAAIDGVPKVPIEVPYGVNLAVGARVTVENWGTLTAPRWVVSGVTGGVRVGTALEVGGSAGGDLSGSYPDPTVAKLRGRAISGSPPGEGEVLKWSASAAEWQPQPALDPLEIWFYQGWA